MLCTIHRTHVIGWVCVGHINHIAVDKAASFDIAAGKTLTLSGNDYTGSDGGAIFVDWGGLFAQTGEGGILVSGNTATGSGGGINNGGGMMSFSGPATFTGNTATDSGGGIRNGSGMMSFSGPATFSGNTAGTNGGAIWNSGAVSLAPTSAGETILFSGNRANNAPNSIYVNASGTLNVGGAGTVDMRDPMAGYATDYSSRIAINKSGTGTWKLGGMNTFTQLMAAKTEFTVSDGTLHLYRAGEVVNGRNGAVETGTIR